MDMLEDDDDLEVFDLIEYGIPRQIYTRNDYFHTLNPKTFFERFRLTKETAFNVLVQIEADLEYPYDVNNCVAPMNQFLIFLRFCATANHLSSIGDFGGMHTATAGRIIARVARVIASRYNQYIKFPQTADEKLSTQAGFYEICRFPRVVGVIDCTHIKIESPGGLDAEVYRNRKNFFSLNVQVICNANLEATDVVARWPGSCHDSTVFRNSSMRRRFEQNHYPNLLLIGDGGYYTKKYLMTPIDQPVTNGEQLYNQSLIRTRNCIERYFGVLKRRFPVLAYGLRLKLDTTMAIIIATCILNNICRRVNEDVPPPENIMDFLVALEVNNVPDIPHEFHNANNPRDIGFTVRDSLVNYFSNLRIP